MDSGCGCKEVYRFPHNYYLSLLTPLVYYMLFFSAASHFLFIFFSFPFLLQYIFVIYLIIFRAV